MDWVKHAAINVCCQAIQIGPSSVEMVIDCEVSIDFTGVVFTNSVPAYEEAHHVTLICAGSC